MKVNENITFNYSNYLKFETGDGQALAKAALKYLSWGVEYSDNAREGARTGNTESIVDKNLVNEWLLTDAERTRENNYFKNGGVFFNTFNNAVFKQDRINLVPGDRFHHQGDLTSG